MVKIIDLTKKQLMDFCQGKITDCSRFYSKSYKGDVEFISKEGYKVTLDDIKAALKLFIKKRLPAVEILEGWFGTLFYELGDVVGIPQLVGSDDVMDFMDLEYGNIFFENEQELAMGIMAGLSELYGESYMYDTDTVDDELFKAFQELLDIIDNYDRNKGKKKSEWILTENQKQDFVFGLADREELLKCSAEEKALYKKYLEELADKGNISAIKQLGYACYGDGDPVFDCDWERSRDCMLKLVELAHDEWKAMASNTLGYIYYYGRCNGGKPQYEEAYKYFSVAAFFGFYEATYKIGDMLASGKGIIQNKEAAYRLYSRVYDENRLSFEMGDDSTFADSALRMAGVYEKGIGVFENKLKAYTYYLQADLAIKERMAQSYFYGDNKVASSIREGIARLKEELGNEVNKKKNYVFMEYFMNHTLLKNNGRLKAKVVQLKTGYKVVFEREMANEFLSPEILITLPEISYCRRTSTITLYPDKGAEIVVKSNKDEIYVDQVKEKNGSMVFYYKGKIVFKADTTDWYVRAEKHA
ncbi:MAG: sel1 repeat family protein [Butyrivibrio sp.]|nr:sel1 repeat family protein [Butyrivibrio sp.]